MKLHVISLCNLNSLYGEQRLDLDEDLQAAPLFLIMGPTGAGKSTLMDAVSLALFGTTPRLTEHTSSKVESDARQVLSRGEGEGWAEVEFSKHAEGVRRRYRARWAVRRAWRRPDGALQAPDRSLEELQPDGSWTILVSDARKKYYEPVFTEVLEGFTALDFQRSMLLAQGQFAAFLQADEQQRADILERLTDTSIYKSIGVRAAIKRRRADKAVELAEARLEGIHLLSEDELDARRARLGVLAAELSERHAQRGFLDTRLRWLGELTQLRKLRAEAEAAQVRSRVARWLKAPRLARLAEHRRVLPVKSLIEARQRAAHTLETSTKQRDEVLATQAQLGPEREEALNVRSRAAAAQKRARDALEQARPGIERSLALDKAHQAAQEQLAQQDVRLGLHQEKLAVRAQVRDDAQVTLAERAAALQRAEAAVQGGGQTEALTAALPALRAQGSALRGLAETVGELREELQSKRTAVTSAREALETARGLLKQRQEAVSPLTVALDAQREALAEALGGAADLASARKAINTTRAKLKQRQQALGELRRSGDEHRTLTESLSELQRTIAKVERSRRRWSRTEAQLKEQQSEALAQLKASEQVLAGLERMRTYSVDRRQLTAGEPCPLCGSSEHPLADDAQQAQLDARLAQEHAQVTEELSQHRTRVDELTRRLSTEKETWLEQRISHKQDLTLQDKQRKQLEKLDERLAEQLAMAGLEELPAPMELDMLLAGCAREHAALEARDEALDQRGGLLQGAKEAHAAAVHQQELAAKDVESRESALRQYIDRVGELEEEFIGKRDLLRLSGNELLEKLRGLGVDSDLDDVQGALDAAAAAVEQHQGQQQAVAEARTAKARAQQALETAAALVQQLQEGAEELARKREELAQAADAAGARAQAERIALGGESAAVLQQRLQEAVDQADVAHKQAEDRFHELDGQVKKLQGQAQAAIAAVIQAQLEDRRAERDLTDALQALDLADAGDAQRRLLEVGEAASLARLERSIAQRCDRADVLASSRQADVGQHVEAQPAHLHPDRVDVGLVRELLAAVKARIEWLISRHGVVGSEINEQERLRREQRDVLSKLEEAREHARLWGRMHELIGRRDGDEFKRFAQALNLGELLSRANEHLSRLASRYRLEPARTEEGLPRLVFEVIDAWQDDARRPLTTLSGGETFLVSLSLALALAEFRATRMPIETLLLDEGFGTLDPETLNVALGALQHLLQTGTQVGIISHVAGLQERIDARVVVEPLGSGRSQVRCELGF